MKMNQLKSVPVLLGLLAAFTHCSGDDNAANNGPDGSPGVDASPSGDDATTSTGDAKAPTGDGAASVPDGGDSGSQPLVLEGVVAATAFTPGSPTEPTVTAGYFKGATVCVDANDNGKCDGGETMATTDATGKFSLTVPALSALIADIGTSATNTASSATNPSRNVFRASIEQVTEQGDAIVLSALSTEVVRLTEANGSTYAAEKQNLATRLSVGAISGHRRPGTHRLQLALGLHEERGPPRGERPRRPLRLRDHQARSRRPLSRRPRGAGRRPRAHRPLRGHGRDGDDHRDAPRDHVRPGRAGRVQRRGDPPLRPHLHRHAREQVDAGHPQLDLRAQDQRVSRGRQPGHQLLRHEQPERAELHRPRRRRRLRHHRRQPVELRRHGGECAVQDLPVPDNTQPGLASSPFATTCTQAVGTNHNIVGKANLFNAISATG